MKSEIKEVSPTQKELSIEIDAATLNKLGLKTGKPVRFRRGEAGRWYTGKMSGVAVDGSITVFDSNGNARSLRPERVEVRRPGTRNRPGGSMVIFPSLPSKGFQ